MKKISMILAIIGISMIMFYSINKATSHKESAKHFKNPIATVVLENEQVFKIELYPEYAPNTVDNFIDLVNKKFYDDMPFSKIMPGYLLQTGDPIGDGTGFPGYFIKSECKQNGFKNKLACKAGTLCMSRAKRYNTEGSQFFILLQDDSGLNGQYTAFGQVIEGMDSVQQIGKANVDDQYVPMPEIKIKTIATEVFGETYNPPEVISIYEARKEK